MKEVHFQILLHNDQEKNYIYLKLFFVHLVNLVVILWNKINWNELIPLCVLVKPIKVFSKPQKCENHLIPSFEFNFISRNQKVLNIKAFILITFSYTTWLILEILNLGWQTKTWPSFWICCLIFTSSFKWYTSIYCVAKPPNLRISNLENSTVGL